MENFGTLENGEERLVIDHSSVNDPDAFIKKAKTLVAEEFNHRYAIENLDSTMQTVDDFYIVWFAKVLGNWKALVSTDVVNGLYWEVTYNGNKNESYVDTYIKAFNRAIPDAL